MDKSPDAFRTISEVADELDLPQHVLRFWETRFSQIKPMKRGGGRRYYRPDDIALLRGIRHLLYGEGYTIRGVQKILREQGLRHVMSVADPARVAPPAEPAAAPGETTPAPAPATASGQPDGAVEIGSGNGRGADQSAALAEGHAPSTDRQAQPMAEPGQGAEDRVDLVPAVEMVMPSGQPAGIEQAGAPVPAKKGNVHRAPLALIDRLRAGSRTAPDAASGLSPEDVRRLQATLFELLECKRLLDQTRQSGK